MAILTGGGSSSTDHTQLMKSNSLIGRSDAGVGARASARFNVVCGAPQKMPDPLPRLALKRRERRAPFGPSVDHAILRFSIMLLVAGLRLGEAYGSESGVGAADAGSPREIGSADAKGQAPAVISRGKPATNSVADLSLEDLVNLKVTSVSKKEEKLNDAAAAIFVLSNDDLRRSGATTLPDALRLAPGLQVAAIGSSDWAVSARGFNSQFANKLLVMIDGRTVYSPLFSGVYWDAQQVFLDDVDRIEVIRGPGATVWGANAVNGVISILSKSARDTQGGLIYGGGGDVHLALGGARYGGKISEDTYYRIYGTYQLNDDFRQANGRSANDRWDLVKGGFRLDHYTGNDGRLTWQGDAYVGNLADHTGDLHGFNTLGRWTQGISDRSSYEVQAFLDHAFRNDAQAQASVDTADLTFQHTFGLGERNDVIWGLGYRFTSAQLDKANSPAITILDHDLPLNLFSAFIQDEFQIIPNKLTFTLGTKVEHNDFTGIEVQPSARLVFKPAENQTVWAAVSRAVRTPSVSEGKEAITFALGAPVVGPGGGLYVPTVVGNTRFESEVLCAYEFGYRIQPNNRVSVDVAAFYNDYSRLLGRQFSSFIPGVPVGTMEIESVNTLRGESYGGEAVLTVAATDSWRLSASYSLLMMHMQGEPASDAESLELNGPTHQVVLRSSYDFTRRASLDAQLRYVDNVEAVAAYVTADIRLSYRPTANLELSLVGQNLLDDRHPEQASLIGAPTTEVPRGFYGRITWRF
jgi:iron complex outermembrane recepter protein